MQIRKKVYRRSFGLAEQMVYRDFGIINELKLPEGGGSENFGGKQLATGLGNKTNGRRWKLHDNFCELKTTTVWLKRLLSPAAHKKSENVEQEQKQHRQL